MSSEDQRLPYTPHLTLKVSVLCFRSSHVSGLWDKIWGSDEFYIQVTCDLAEGPTEFYTKPFRKRNYVSIYDDFTFVFAPPFSDENQQIEQLKIKVAVFKGNKNYGRDSIDASDFNLDDVYERTLKFGSGQHPVKVEVEVEKIFRSGPDFRLSFGVCDEELRAARRRKAHVLQHMQTAFPRERKPVDPSEVPTVSLLCSGGGYRSTIQFCGAMEALQETGILDMVTYISALSGGAWYVLSAYAKQALDDQESMRDFHKEIKSSTKTSLMVDAIVNWSNYLNYRKYARNKEMEGQPVTFVDFYGYMLGKTFLGNHNLPITLSDLRDYADTGEVPIPIATAIHARSKVSSASFHADLEMTPWEVCMPHYGINIKTKKFGSEWYQGNVVRSCPELPLHFYLGATSSAFGILLKYFLGGETTETDSAFIEVVRQHEFGRHNTKVIRKSRRKRYWARKKSSLGSIGSVPEVEEVVVGTKRSSRRISVFSSKKSMRRSGRASTRRKNSYVYGTSMRRSFSKQSHNPSEPDEWYDAVEALNHAASNLNMDDPARPSLERAISQNSHRLSVDHLSAVAEDERNGNITSDSLLNQLGMKNSIRATRSAEFMSRRQSIQPNTVANVVGVGVEEEKQKENSAYMKKLFQKISHHPLFTDREAVIDRTSKVLNFARGFETHYFPLNPSRQLPKGSEEFMKLPIDDDAIMFVDPAVINNVPTNSTLRSNRKSDILIVCDATEYASDMDIDYLELFIAENGARLQGLKFPKIDPNILKDNPRGAVHIFEDKNDPECPVVIWFTLCNKEFKQQENVDIPPKMRDRLPAKEKFNDFPVFGPSSPYSTLNTRYTTLQFDRLKELMKFNITNHAEDIKREIWRKIAQRRRMNAT